jgi:signal transduction histidine kinase
LASNVVFCMLLRGRPTEKRLRYVAYSALATDLAFVTGWIYVKGGIESRMLILYCLPILMSAALLTRQTVYIVTAAAVIAYDGLIALDYSHIISSIGDQTNMRYDIMYVINSMVFFGGILVMTGILADFITRQLQAKEREARTTAAALQRAQEIAKVGSWEWDIASDQMTGSQELYRIFGLKHSESKALRQTDLLGRVLTADRQAVEEKFLNCLKGGLPIRSEFRIERRRQTAYVRVEGRVKLDHNHQTVKMFGTAQDITDEKSLESAKNEFVALASHQLRTPATSVKILLSLLRDGYSGPLKTEQRDMVDQAFDANERQLHIVNNVLSVAQLDAKRINLRRRTYDVRDTVARVIADYQNVLDERHQRLQTDVTEEPLYVKGDSTYLYIVCDNLLSNASKYTPEEGHIRVSVSANRGLVNIAVSDDGIGIHKHMAKHIYEKFKRLKNQLTDETEGSGLGLYLTKEIVEMHGGRIKFSSVPGGGSTFTISLPKSHRPRHVAKATADQL